MPAALRYRLPVRSFFLPCSNKKFPVQLRREFGVQVLDSASCFGDRNRNLAPECAKFPVFSQISGNSDQRLFRWGLHPPPRSRAKPDNSSRRGGLLAKRRTAPDLSSISLRQKSFDGSLAAKTWGGKLSWIIVLAPDGEPFWLPRCQMTPC